MPTENVLAALAWVLLVLGWLAHRRRRLHLSLVVPAILTDLGLVVALEVGRDVIARTVEEPHTLPQQVHILSSLAAVLLYVPVVALGLVLVFGRAGPAPRRWHRRTALAALAARTVGFVFMWAM
jgi:uncharacterized protein (TIGR03382 family)